MSYIIGVDPGLTGVVAILTADGRLVDVFDMPSADGHVLGGMLKRAIAANTNGDQIAWVEDVHSMPGQGVASTFKFGRAVGVVAGVLGAESIPVRWVTPARWKRTMGLTKDKGVCRRRAQELWPGHATYFQRVRDDGRAEAALIAEYGRTRQA